MPIPKDPEKAELWRIRQSLARKGKPSYFRTQEHRDKMREIMTGRKVTWGDKISKSKKGVKTGTPNRRSYVGENNPFYGKKHKPEAWVKRRETMIKNGTTQIRETHPQWKGGISKSRSTIYDSIGYKEWREAVFRRDNYTCQNCGDSKGHNLIAHHIVPFSHCIIENIELLYSVENGLTVCDLCHKLIHKYLRSNKSSKTDVFFNGLLIYSSALKFGRTNEFSDMEGMDNAYPEGLKK